MVVANVIASTATAPRKRVPVFMFPPRDFSACCRSAVP